MVKQIIKEAMDRNPIGLKEALQEELKSRVALALEAKMDDLDEAVEQLDELSPKTLISYRKKADKHIDKLQKIVDRSDKIIYKHHLAAGRSKGADRIASNARSDAALRQAETEAGRAARTASTTAKKAADAEKIKDAANRKIDQRDLGRERAYDRLHKEEYDQLDEISGKTLGSYIQKARAQDSAKIAHNKELDNHPKVKALKDKMSDLYSRRDYSKRNQKSINKTRTDIEAQKKKLDPNYPETARPKRHRGVEKAIKKLTYGKMTDSYEDYNNED
jgi:hypothetical protein